jgi:hypothetical protein
MVSGARQLAADLAAVADDLPAAVERADNRAAQLLATAAQRGAPRRSGRLAGSIDPGDGVVTVSAPYGAVIHDGWARRHIRAQPFLADAATRTDWPGPYVDATSDALDNLQSNY